MTYGPLAPYLICTVSYTVGSFVMYRVMKRKLDKAWARFDDLRTAYQMKLGENRELWLGQQRLYKSFQELLRSRTQ